MITGARGPWLNSLRLSSSKNLTGQARIMGQGAGGRVKGEGKRHKVQGVRQKEIGWKSELKFQVN